MRRHRRECFAALAQVVADPVAETVDGLDDGVVAGMVDLALAHRVAGSVRVALVEAGRAVPDVLIEAEAAATAAHLQTLRALDRVRRALDGAGVRWVVVKGPAVAARWPGHPATRAYDDLDLLVDPRSLRLAVDALGEVGYGHRNTNWTGFRSLGVGELPLDDGTTVIDLHWHLIGLERQRRAFRLETAALLDRAVAIRIGGLEVPTLDEADTLLHLCCHDGLAGAQSLVQLRDVHLLAAAVPVDVARARFRAAGVARLASVVVDRAERVFGPAGPSPVAEAMCGAAGWVCAHRLADVVWSRLPLDTWTPFPGALVQAGRPTAGATARAVLSALALAVGHRTGRPTLVSDGGPLDWAVDDGGAAGLDRYLDEVAAGCFGS